MSDVLKGNYSVKRPVQPEKQEKGEETLTEELERRLLAKLGGSVCYVKGKPFIARPERSTDARPDDKP